MSEFTRKLRERVEARLKPLTPYLEQGDKSPVVRMALDVLKDAEAIEAELAAERLYTDDAAERTGWTPATLQRWARAVLKNTEPVPQLWAGLQVEEAAAGYLFVVGSIPKKLRASA